MRRTRRRSSRTVGIVLVAVVGTAAVAAVWKMSPDKSPEIAGLPIDGGISPTATITPPPLIPEAPKPQKELPKPLLATTRMPATPTVPPKAEPTPRADSPKVEAPKFAAPAPEPARPLALSATGNAITDGRRLYDAGELVAARSILNSALAAGQLTGNDRDVARDLLAKISQQVIFSKRIFKDDPYSSAYTVQSGDRLVRVAAGTAVTWELLGRVNGIPDPRKVRALQTIKLVKGPFHATISKSKFVMDIYLGAPGGASSVFVMSFPVGLGKDDSTPLGTWQVQPQSKLKNPTYYSPRGEGIIAADDPKNPLGEFWIGLTGIDGHAVNKASYGIHGTIDPASIGKEESMGCIRMKNEDVAIVYELLVEGKSQVVVKE